MIKIMDRKMTPRQAAKYFIQDKLEQLHSQSQMDNLEELDSSAEDFTEREERLIMDQMSKLMAAIEQRILGYWRDITEEVDNG